MRVSLFSLVTILSLSLVAAAPSSVCPLSGISTASLSTISPPSYVLKFTWHDAKVPIDFIDMHYRVNSGDFVNVRAFASTTATPSATVTHPLILSPGDVLHAMVTYSAGGVGCDVPIDRLEPAPTTLRTAADNTNTNMDTAAIAPSNAQTAAAIPTPACPFGTVKSHVVQSTEGMMIVAQTEMPMDYIDVHAEFGTTSDNIRIGSNTASAQSPILPLADNDHLNYYITYSKGNLACNSNHFTTAAPATEERFPLA